MSRRKGIWLLVPAVAVAAVWFGWRAGAGTEPERGETTMENVPHCRKLTPAEERVIVRKGTEIPFTGEYWNHHADGTYRCKRCQAPLFSSEAKFESGTGWPSFDSALPGAVKEVPDADGARIEIVCAACGAHLGHVFRGEGFTARDVRHCVNSISLSFDTAQAKPAETSPAGEPTGMAVAAASGAPAVAATTQEAFFAGGCFWGVEYWFDRTPGVILAESGYMGGHTSEPSYEQVCDHGTGHAETVRVVFDPAKISYEALARLFFEIHDPTQVDRQGPDVGDQYRSAIFTRDEAQKRTAEKLIAELEGLGYKVATRVEPAGTFWRAEEYHQDYYAHKGSTPYCHTPVRRFAR